MGEEGKTYEIQRYRYGRGPFYTAFCLVPWRKPEAYTFPDGRVRVVGNGPKTPGTLHFERLVTALEHIRKSEMRVRNLNRFQVGESEVLLPGTISR
jgi:hypothetical protein